MTRLLIKYNDNYICEQNHNEIDFIHIPNYHPKGNYFSNISIFITLISNGYLNYDYSSSVYLLDHEWSNLFEEYFLPEYLQQVDEDIYIYNLDNFLKEQSEYKKHFQEVLSNLPINLVHKNKEELKNTYIEPPFDETIPYTWNYQTTHISKELEKFIEKSHKKITNNDVLLMYSGGKDSTLSAFRLYNAGYNIHFIHFNNGHMKDTDKPYLTFKKSFEDKDGFYFNYEFSNVNIKKEFEEYFSNWNNSQYDSSLTSEIRCLSCRMAMYTKAIMIAKEYGFKYIAEGARISQKFMLEQQPMINRLKDLASIYGIKLIFPVLYLSDNQKEIEELINNGHSSKTWESKCLIGSPAKEKTREDERIILEYFETKIKPQILKRTK